jgi:hypothetical protein
MLYYTQKNIELLFVSNRSRITCPFRDIQANIQFTFLFLHLGMIPMYDPRSRIQIQCITLLYEDPSRNVPVTFEGVTVFQTLLVHHPKMVLDFSVELIKEALAAIRLKTESSPSSEVFVDKIKSVCELISTSPSIAPLIASHQGRGNPYAIIRLGVASP